MTIIFFLQLFWEQIYAVDFTSFEVAFVLSKFIFILSENLLRFLSDGVIAFRCQLCLIKLVCKKMAAFNTTNTE